MAWSQDRGITAASMSTRGSATRANDAERWMAKHNGRKIAAIAEVPMNFTIEHEREEDGRWLAEVPELPGVLAYGATANEAMGKAEALALRVPAERLEHDEAGPRPISIAVPAT